MKYEAYTQVRVSQESRSPRYGFIANCRNVDPSNTEIILVSAKEDMLAVQKKLIEINLLADREVRMEKREAFVQTLVTVNVKECKVDVIESAEFIRELIAKHFPAEKLLTTEFFEVDPYLLARQKDCDHNERFMSADLTDEQYYKNVEYANTWYAMGVQHGISKGICEATTYGYGRLDAYGYWEFPIKEGIE